MIANFTILESADQLNYIQFSLKKLVDYYHEGETVLVFAETDICQELDRLLWFDGEPTFIPHDIMSGGEAVQLLGLPIIFVSDQFELKKYTKEILLDLSLKNTLADHFCSRVVKIVDQDPARLVASRGYYKKLKLKGYELTVEKINNTSA